MEYSKIVIKKLMTEKNPYTKYQKSTENVYWKKIKYILKRDNHMIMDCYKFWRFKNEITFSVD